MKIAFVTTEYITEKNSSGGLAAYLGKITEILNQSGGEVYCIVASSEDGAFKYQGINVYRVNTNIKCISVFGAIPKILLTSFLLNRKLVELNKLFSIDVVQFASYQSLALFKPKNIKSIVRLSSLHNLWQEGYFGRITLQDRVIQFLELLAIKRCGNIIGPSQFIGKKVEKLTGRKVDLVRTPIELLSTDIISNSNIPYLVFFGTMTKLKGIDQLVHILHDVLETHQDIHFFFIGRDTHTDQVSFTEQILHAASKHKGRVKVFGQKPRDELWRIVAAAEAVVLPSKYDNYPNACLEAMSLGKIVVAPRGASFDEIIDDGNDGILFEYNSIESLKKSIDKVLLMPKSLQQDISLQAKRKVNFLRDKALNEHIDYYSGLVETEL